MRDERARDFVLTDYARSLIRFKAHQLSRRSGFSRSDREDLEQELTLRLLRQAHRFDPERASLDTFVDRVVNSAVAMILRDRRREKRAGEQTTQSLHAETLGHGQTSSLAGKITEADRHRRHGTAPHDERADVDTADALEQALGNMPPQVSDIFRRVMGGSITSVANALQTSRHQVRTALQTAWPYLEQAGFTKPHGADGQPRTRRHK